MNSLKKLEGIIPVLATPLTREERVDETGLCKLIRHVMQAENAGIVVCGSIGEFAALSYEERRRAIEIAVDEVNGRLPIIAGTGDSGTRKAVENTKVAEAIGADCALITLPFYYWTDRDGTVEHYQRILRETSLPIVIYNIPMFTHVAADLEAVKELGREERIVGIKDAGGDFTYFQNLVHEMGGRGSFSVIQGWDSLIYSGFVYGGDAAIVWASNLVPDLPVRLYGAIKRGDLKEAQSIQGTLLRLGKVMQKRKSLHVSLKAALSLMGICNATVSQAITPLTGDEMKELEADLKQIGILQ